MNWFSLYDTYGSPSWVRQNEKPTPKPYKHIKFKAELVMPMMEEVRVTILEQTHYGGDFGKSESFGVYEPSPWFV